MVHVFVPNHHGTDLLVRCMRPYDEYRQFTPIQKGAPAVMQRCLITASKRTANANGDTEAGTLMFGSLYFILIKYQLAVKLAMWDRFHFHFTGLTRAVSLHKQTNVTLKRTVFRCLSWAKSLNFWSRLVCLDSTNSVPQKSERSATVRAPVHM